VTRGSEAILAQVELLRRCSRHDLTRIAALAAPLEVDAGTIVATAGARDTPLILVLNGMAHAEGPDGSQIQLERGAHVGEVTLLDGGPAPSTVTAVTPMRLAVIERRNFVELLRATPSIATRILVGAGQEVHRRGERSGDSSA
jgi:CRP/FNR family transcriptional regulator, cyclic AMP receptor protein